MVQQKSMHTQQDTTNTAIQIFFPLGRSDRRIRCGATPGAKLLFFFYLLQKIMSLLIKKAWGRAWLLLCGTNERRHHHHHQQQHHHQHHHYHNNNNNNNNGLLTVFLHSSFTFVIYHCSINHCSLIVANRFPVSRVEKLPELRKTLPDNSQRPRLNLILLHWDVVPETATQEE